MDASLDGTASLLVRRQANFDTQHVQPRAGSFSATIVVRFRRSGDSCVGSTRCFGACSRCDSAVRSQNRFFTDSSLGRQKRLLETTRRRQAKAREKALEQVGEHLALHLLGSTWSISPHVILTLSTGLQNFRLERLQLDFEENLRLKTLKEERELSRMERKLQNAAATYIQYVWRKHRYFANLRAKRDCAARYVIAAIRFQAGRRRRKRHHAAIAIQAQWRAHQRQERFKRCLLVVSRFMRTLVRARRAKRNVSAVRIQRWLRRRIEGRRRAATAVLQRAWRAQLSKKKIARCSRVYRHLKELEKLERHAKVLQRALATRAAYCRLIRSSELARYPLVMATTLPKMTLVESQAELQQSWRAQSEAALTAKRLSSQEAALTRDVESLHNRLRDAKAKLTREQDKLERFRALDAHRRAKDDTEIQHRLLVLEAQMRRDVRMELEKELENSRRAQAREHSKRQKQATIGTGSALSITTSGRYTMRKPGPLPVVTAGNSLGRLSGLRSAASEERHE